MIMVWSEEGTGEGAGEVEVEVGVEDSGRVVVRCDQGV